MILLAGLAAVALAEPPTLVGHGVVIQPADRFTLSTGDDGMALLSVRHEGQPRALMLIEPAQPAATPFATRRDGELVFYEQDGGLRIALPVGIESPEGLVSVDLDPTRTDGWAICAGTVCLPSIAGAVLGGFETGEIAMFTPGGTLLIGLAHRDDHGAIPCRDTFVVAKVEDGSKRIHRLLRRLVQITCEG